jgi:hypothetical protein
MFRCVCAYCVFVSSSTLEEMAAAVLHTLTLVYESGKRLENIAAQG